MEDRGNPKAVRILTLIVALIAMIALGMTTPPNPQATLSSRLIVFAFTLAVAIVMVTTIALIPSPPDPRERQRQVSGDLDQESEGNADSAGSAIPAPPLNARRHRMHDPGGDDG